MHQIIVLTCGFLTIATALMVIFSRNTVHSALWMVGNCFLMAVLFLLLQAQFIAILQVIVYAGAVMMFILYAVMILNLRGGDAVSAILKRLSADRLILLVLFLFGLIIFGVGYGSMALKGTVTEQAMMAHGETKIIADYIFESGVLPFELVSVLLTAGIVGAVYLAKKD